MSSISAEAIHTKGMSIVEIRVDGELVETVEIDHGLSTITGLNFPEVHYSMRRFARACCVIERLEAQYVLGVWIQHQLTKLE